MLTQSIAGCIVVIEILMDEMLHRVPALGNTEIRQIINGPECFTPDGSPLFGEAPEVIIALN